MLYLVSLGLKHDDLTEEGREAIERCATLYAEEYTAPVHLPPGKHVVMLERAGVEQGARKLIIEARTKDVALLVGGDAVFATTHLSLVLDCRRAGIPVRVIHAPSILSYVWETGLSAYKFGEIVSVPRWTASYKPTSFYATIQKNQRAGLHTLLLLEPGMGVREGVQLLQNIEMRKRKKLFSGQLIVLSKLGGNALPLVGTAQQLPDLPAPACLVLPGRLNAFEEEFLASLEKV